MLLDSSSKIPGTTDLDTQNASKTRQKQKKIEQSKAEKNRQTKTDKRERAGEEKDPLLKQKYLRCI